MPSNEKSQFAIVKKDTQEIITFDITDSNLMSIFALFKTEQVANKMLYNNDIDDLCEVIEVTTKLNQVKK